MKELRFSDWKEFQSLCRFWMQHLVQRNVQRHSTYYVFGSEGEGQGGVDLVPDDPELGVVGQSKCWNTKVLTWRKIEEELNKTDDYKGLIEVYVILTTAPRHSSVQLAMPGDKCNYRRKQGDFRVRIFYWDELPNLDFIPQAELRRVFPRLFSLADPPTPAGPSRADYVQSLAYAREFLPTLISRQHLDWLATWDFTKGYVPARFFDLFADLFIEIVRTNRAIGTAGLRHWLNEGYRLQLSRCLPAAEPVFEAIESFAAAVNGATTSIRMPDGSTGYGHGWPVGTAERITKNWKTHAQGLLTAYQEIVEGAVQN
ncbi:hypothetical protein [Pseudomonas koreensis]